MRLYSSLAQMTSLNLLEVSFMVLIIHLGFLQGNADIESSFRQEVQSYQFVSPRLSFNQQGRWRRTRDTSTKSSSGGHLGRATFSLRGFGKEFVLDVVQNRILFSANYVSRYFNTAGREIIAKNERNENCFYQGNIQGLKHSTVAISTCQGIEGMIYDGNETYYIQPFPENPDRHIMYRASDLKTGEKHCGVKHSDFTHAMKDFVSLGKHRSRRSLMSETKFVELLLVNDHSQYRRFNNNRTAVEYRSKMIANIVDSLFRPLKVRIALTAVETWTQKDKIVVDPDSDKSLRNFMKYRNSDLVRNYKHDNAQLLTYRDFEGSTVGKASVLAMCGDSSGGVVQDHSVAAAATAATLAHEMGHNFGFLHDEDIEGCKCDAPAADQGCIMSAVAKSKPSTDWSSCSFNSFDKYLKRGLDACLFNTPSDLFGDAYCGNGFKEEGEECDCGTLEECERYSDSCCNATTCKLHPASECDSGLCCDKCKYKPQGSLCRDKVNECDLPEVCTGRSGLCPRNKYVQDGTTCANGEGYCFKSKCPLHDTQCKDFWGEGALSGPDGCYNWNKQGTYRGHCGYQGANVYVKCDEKDKLCGMLQCTKVDDKTHPIIGHPKGSYGHTSGGTLCKSASVTLGADIPDPGETSEGTKCGENKLCIERKCVSIHALNTKHKPCPNNCSGENGICNNEAECFCLSCWTGADCSVWVECKTEGNGTEYTISTPPTNFTDVPGTTPPQAKRSKLAGILILVFILIFLIVGAVFAFIYRKQLEEKWRTFKQKARSSERYQGLSRTSPKQTRDRNGAGAIATTNSELPKLRPNISGPTLQSSTRKEPTVNVTHNPLGTSRFIAAKYEQPASQPAVVFKPTPPKPEQPKPPVVEKEKRPPNLPPVKLRNREWPPKGDKTASLNRASSPPSVTEPTRPVKPVKPPRPESHAGILDKPSVPPHPSVKALREWPPREKKNDTQSNPTQASKAPASQPTVPLRPVPKAVKGPSEERPSSLPLKPSDIKKGLGTGNDRPISASNPVGPKKVPLKPPGPIPRRPGSKPA